MTCWQDSTGLSRGTVSGSKPKQDELSEFKRLVRVEEEIDDEAGHKLGDQDKVENSLGACVDDWHDFNNEPFSTSSSVKQCDPNIFFQQCFPTVATFPTEVTISHCVFHENRLLQSQKCGHPDTLGHFILSKFNVILSYKSGSPFPRNKQNLNLPLPAECNDFDWNDDVKEAIRLDEKSPVVFKPTQPDSPIGIDFDETRAVIGLAVLSKKELQKMILEMESKFTHMSEVLISDLTHRDKLIFELSVKNKLISALLQVQELRHSNLLPNRTSKLESVGRVLHVAPKSKVNEEKTNSHFLSLVIPYDPPYDHQWKLNILQKITDILNGIAEGSSTVPQLISDYIQHVLQSGTDDN